MSLVASRCFPRWLWIAGMAFWIGAGAIFWAHNRDPFDRVWFSVRGADHPRARCVAVLPKNAPQPYPVVIYLHGSGGRLLGDGNDLRQMAEMGLAAVAMDYCQTNAAASEAQFAALLRHLRQQAWADTNAMAWLGYSLGAEQVTRFWLRRPEARPRLLVRLAGGWMEELEQPGVRKPESADPQQGGTAAVKHTVLLVHGDQDGVFPVAEAERFAAVLRTNEVPAELEVWSGQGHSLTPNRGVLFRVLGEDCLTRLRGEDALAQYQSIGLWREHAWPLWVCWLPALVWLIAWGCIRWRTGLVPLAVAMTVRAPRAREGSLALRWLAAVVALAALALTGLHGIVPQLACTGTTVAIARRCLVSPKARADFEWLVAQRSGDGQRLGALLEHADLARYNRQLVNWTVAEPTYRDYVLSPFLESETLTGSRWRRPLWESLYPRIRKETSEVGAAAIVVSFLRERVTVTDRANTTADVVDIWRRQRTDSSGFELLTVAALRSVGIAARLRPDGRGELLAGGRWQAAPQPVMRATADRERTDSKCQALIQDDYGIPRGLSLSPIQTR